MNNTFNIQRFGLLLKRQWLEFGKIYLITLAVALGVIISFYAFILYAVLMQTRGIGSNDLGFREPLFLILGFLFITVISSNYFAHLGQKPKAITDLMIPASIFEKFLTGIFFTAIMSTVCFAIIFYLTDLAFVGKLRSIFQNFTTEESRNGVTVVVDHLAYFFTENNPKEFKSLYLIAPFFVTSVFLLGSIYFNRFHYIKTAISIIIFSGIWTYIIFKTAESLLTNKVPVTVNRISNPKQYIEIYALLLLAVLTLIFWIITYIRLKEKEV